jgi:hypothetical protein
MRGEEEASLNTRTALVRAKWVAAAWTAAALTLAGDPSYAQKAKPGGKGAPAAAKADKKPSAAEKKALAEAKAHYAAGQNAFKAGSYASALTEFQAADGIKPTPQAARMIGLCYDRLGKFPDAIAAYDRFLAGAPANMATQVDETKAREEAIRKLPGKVHVETDPQGATISVDGTATPSVSPADVEIAPGHHKLSFAAPGHDTVEREVDVTFASAQPLSVQLPASAAPPAPVAVAPLPEPPPPEPPPPPPEPAAEEPQGPSRVPAYVFAGLAIAAAGVGTAYGVMAIGDKSDYDAHPTASKADDGESHAHIADMAFGAALALGVTSAVLLFTTSSGDSSSSAAPSNSALRISPTPLVTQGGGGAGALVRF